MTGTATAGAVDVLLRADTAQYDSAMSRSAANAERELARTERAQKKAAVEADRFVAVVQRQIDTFGLSGTALLRYEANLKGVSDKALPLIERLERIKQTAAANAAQFDASSKSVNQYGVSAAQTAAAFRSLPAQMTDVATQVAGGQNPLLILLQQGGQVKDMFGGLRPAIAALATYVTPTAVAAVALAAGVSGAALAFVQGRGEAHKFGTAVALTGNYAGVTAAQVDAMSRRIATSAEAHLGVARQALQGLVASGDVGPRLLAPMATAITTLQKTTDEKVTEIVADFVKMGDGAAKWALEHDKALNFVTAAQYAQAKALEEAGRKEEAGILILNALNNKLGQLPPTLGYLEGALHTAGNAWDVFWAKAKSIGGPESIQAQIAKLDAETAKRKSSDPGLLHYITEPVLRMFSGGGESDRQQQRTRNALEAAADQEAQAASLNAHVAASQRAGKAAVDFLDKLNAQAKGAGQLASALAELHRQQDAYRRTVGPISPEDAAAQEAYVRRINTPPATPKTAAQKAAAQLDTRFDDRLLSLQQEGLRLDAEIASWQQYGRSIDKARVAILDLDIAQGKLKGLDAGRIASLRAAAAADDEKDKALDVAKLNAELDKRVTKLRAAADAQAMNAREVQVANELAAAESAGLVRGTAAWEAYATKVRSAVAAERDQALARSLAAQALNAAGEVQRLNEEVRLIGLSTLERQKAAVALRLEAEARKDIRDNPGQTAQILDAMVARRDALTAAIERNYAASRIFDAGMAQSLRRYQEDAANAAKSAESVTTGSLQRMEDAVVQFSHTGRLNLGGLFQFMADEFLRQRARMFLGTLSGGFASGGFGGLLDAAVGYFTGGASGAVASLVPVADGSGSTGDFARFDRGLTKLATGTNYIPADGPYYLHKGESVQPVAYNPAAGGQGAGIVVNQTVHGGVTRNDLSLALNALRKQILGEIGLARRNGSLAYAS